MPQRISESDADRFVEKWSNSQLSERAASHEHFIDLCRLFDQPTPASADATGAEYTFEKPVKVTLSASKGSKGDAGFVDVWKKGCFAWEYKRKGKYKNLDEAYRQLYQYRDALDNPPLSVVCDIRTIVIRTHFQGYPTAKIELKLEEIPGRLELIRRLFVNPDSFKPAKTTETVTLDLANEFGKLADRLIERYPPDDLNLFQRAGDPVAHFLMKVMFCLFAESIRLLPDKAFTKIVQRSQEDPEKFTERATKLFAAMRTGGEYGSDEIPYFNGGLFDDKPAIPLTHGDLTILRWVADRDWAGVEPSIFGTLFERLLDPKKRAQIGAHYTSKADILLVVEPVVMLPLRRKWQAILDEMKDAIEKHDAEPDRKLRDLLSAPIRIRFDEFRRHLGAQRILDPACGSGNFLYVALRELLDLDDQIVRLAAHHDIPLNPIPYVRPVHGTHAQLMGIEINRYAAELAQVVIWIGYLQWLSVRGIDPPHNPILSKLDCIDNRDAILDLSDKDNPAPAKWPEADFIIGNPPFSGSKVFRENGLTDEYVAAMFSAFDLRQTSDFCCYWFELARLRILSHTSTRAGLLATQRIRGDDSRDVLERIKKGGDIFLAWSDRKWIPNDRKTAVHVAIIGFDDGRESHKVGDGNPRENINADLTYADDYRNEAAKLAENRNIGFMADTKGNAFEGPAPAFRALLASPNPHGRTNADVMRPWVNGIDISKRCRGLWIIDFGTEMTQSDAASFEAPFEYVREHVFPERRNNRRESYRRLWWRHVEPRPAMRRAIAPLDRVIVTVATSKHRLFAWLGSAFLADHKLTVFARDDDYFLGNLHSAAHEIWTRTMGGQVRDVKSGFTYTSTTCFETFPLPWPPGKEEVKHPAYQRIASAARDLDEKRERWLNPPEWIEQVAANVDAADRFEDVPESARPLIRQSAIMAAAAEDARLKKRTLTNLYNERPTWLKLAHETLDRSVLAAYAAVDPQGNWSEDWAAVWVETGAGQKPPADSPQAAERTRVDQAVLGNLLRLNQARVTTTE
jgi:hypothetical protein